MTRFKLVEFKRWLRTSEQKSPATIERYISSLKRLDNMLSEHVDQYDAQAINMFITQILMSKHSKLLLTAALRKYYLYNSRFDLVYHIMKPKHKQKSIDKWLSETIFNEFVAVCNDDNERLIIKLLFETATRKNEFLNITCDVIDMQQRRITIVGKGGVTGVVRFSESTKELLERYISANHLKGSDKIFDFSYSVLYYKIKEIAKRTGHLEIAGWITPHKFRHSWASIAKQKGMPIESIQRYLRHRNIMTTSNFYVHIMSQDAEKEYDRLFN